MIWLSDFNHVFFLLLFYLIDANVNHENWNNGFPKSIYYIIVKGICVFFSSFFFFFFRKPNEDRFIFYNYSFVSFIIRRFVGKKYNEISIDFIY